MTTATPDLGEALRAVRRPVRLPSGECVPACRLEDLGDATFRADHRLRYAYAAGAMANGIGSAEIVEAMSRAGMLGFFGSAGLSLERVESAVDRLMANLSPSSPLSGEGLQDCPSPFRGGGGGKGSSFGFNLINSPNEPDLEAALVDLYLRRGVRLVEASAYLDLTLPVVRYRLAGIGTDASGNVTTPNRIVAKVSRVEVASKFLAPPPERFVQELLRRGELTAEQARLAAHIPMAQDLTAEADSGGHTDNRPAITLLPTMLALRDRMQERFGYAVPLRVGAAGGIATPASAAAAFVMGAAYVVTGTVNQACIESGSSDLVREMLAQAEQADVAMAPSADMFEMGVKVQVLKRGTMFAMRAAKLYELYRTCSGLDNVPPAEVAGLEKNLFRAPLEEIWRRREPIFSAATRRRWNGPSATRSTRWPWCSAGISANRRAGRTRASRRASSTTRCGAARRWAPSTSGPGALSWSSRATAAW